MLGNPVSYAAKKRKKPTLKQKKLNEGNEVVQSNPSKRHRDRLNGELHRLTNLLPFSEEVRSRLDKLSVLRLSVGYLRIKSYFNASMRSSKSNLMFPAINGQNGNNMDTAGFSEGDLLLQALDGFVMVVTAEGLVFYVSPTIKDYLGFHQLDVVHQSVFELIHTDDRAMFRQQLRFAPNPPSDTDGAVLQSYGAAVMYSPEQLPPENSSHFQRNFVCRFRCLLDNSSGFLALKFQGRLKYLHGQNDLRSNGTCTKPQLALLTIVVPVNPPAIVEVRVKMILFQSKHKLDFTPLGIDSRGKVILGYSETELCMKGSGYQFIHAADMMYCADNHLRMIKMGETGMTVFRLLRKSGSWVWVKSNAKLIYKDGRPDFIIAYQRALVNSEGEEYLRQRRLQLPFSYTTGEAVLYDTGPTVDISQFQFNRMFSDNDKLKDVIPGSLLDCFLKQDGVAYTQEETNALPVDQVFMDSRALLNIPSDVWQENDCTSATGAPVELRDEAKQSLMAVIDNLEQLAQNGDLCSALHNLDVDESELMEWKNSLKGLSQGDDRQNSVGSDLDSIFSNDMFDYIDAVLFHEKGGNAVNVSSPSCLTAVSSSPQREPFAKTARLSAAGLSEPKLFPTPSPDCTYPQLNGIYSHQQDGQSSMESAQMFSNGQRLSHRSKADINLPSLQHLQLQDIYSPFIELPELTVPDNSADDASATFQSCGQACMGDISGRTQSSQILCPQSTLQANGQLLQSSVKQPHNVVPGMIDVLPPLIPCNDFYSSTKSSIPFPAVCLQGNVPLETHKQQVQQWPQGQQQTQPHTDVTPNGYEATPPCRRPPPESQTFPHAGPWLPGAPRPNHVQQGRVACGQAAAHSSCMFDQHFSCTPAGGDVMALSRSCGPRGADVPLDQSPPQGSCYFQWSDSEPVVGSTSALPRLRPACPAQTPPAWTAADMSTRPAAAWRAATNKTVRK